MIKLTDTQMNVLAAASQRPDGLASRPAGVKPAQLTKMMAALVEAGLAKEVRTKAGNPMWRKDEAGRELSLKVLKAGRAAGATLAEVSVLPLNAGSADGKLEGEWKPVAPAADVAARRAPKRSAIVALMQRPGGASIADLIEATGWLPHTTRAALTGLRKKGVAIARSQTEQGGGSIYRIDAAA